MKKIITAVIGTLITSAVVAQQATPETTPTPNPNHANTRFKNGLNFYLNNDSTHFIKFTFTNQVWVRYNTNNPGSTVNSPTTPVNNVVEANTFDIGLRRTRMQLYGQVTDRVFFYTQFGENNFNYLSTRKANTFFHDALVEYAVSPKHLSIGGGLSGWTGMSRYSSPGISSILTLDAPLFAQATNDATDQFLRKLSVYAKGKLGKLDYRVAVSKPMAYQNSTLYSSTTPITVNSDFAPTPPQLQYHGYLMYQFLDQESNQIAYTTGTYLGKKKVFNIGAGFVYQQDAMWRQDVNSKGTVTDTVKSALQLFAVDVFYDAPINKEKGTAITVYAGYFSTNFGKGYIRNLGPMAPTTGIKAGTLNTFNGTGSAFPMLGTGSIIYGQVGFLLPDKLLGTHGKLQPYAAYMYAQYDRLNNPVNTIDAGFNWLINGHGSKLSLNYQSRPIYNKDINSTTGNGVDVPTARRGCIILQYQIAI
jgi:hypothetical protein